MANTLPFLLLGWFVMLRGVGEFILVSLIAGLISGAGIWLFGAPDTIHIGMSGVIFGYLGFLLGRGYFERSAIAIGLAFLVGLLYGSMIWGVFPIQPNISWQGHLFGLLWWRDCGLSSSQTAGGAVQARPRLNTDLFCDDGDDRQNCNISRAIGKTTTL
ncbi:MAG: rhomboid family intramembrane serine protease [Caldilineaceae bacterium]